MTIAVYLDDGRVFKYDIEDDVGKAREHAGAIVATGYRHVPATKDVLEWFPPHRIVKVKIVGKIETSYTDVCSGT